jgi:hypothetical protein
MKKSETIKSIWKAYSKQKPFEFEDYLSIMNCLSNNGLVEFDTLEAGGDCDSYIYTSYYSKKLGLNIELDVDSFTQIESEKELRDIINGYHKQIKEVEAKII